LTEEEEEAVDNDADEDGEGTIVSGGGGSDEEVVFGSKDDDDDDDDGSIALATVESVVEEEGINEMGLSVIHLQAPESAIFTSNLTLDFLSILAAIMATFFI